MLTWKLVALGDSFPAGFGVGGISYIDHFIKMLRMDNNINVDVVNFAQSGARTSDLLLQLQSNLILQEKLQTADIVTIWIGWNDMIYALSLFDSKVCGGVDNLDCIRKAAKQINNNLDGIYDCIMKLIQPSKAKVFIADYFIPPALIEMWHEHGDYASIKEAAYESWRRYLVSEAEERGIQVVGTYQALNGPEGITMLEGKTQADGFHLNRKGHKNLAEIHYETIFRAI